MEEFGFCNLSCIPVRFAASDRSEMVNQLLFGETFEVVDAFHGWKLIRGTLDNYEGFIDEKQYLPIGEEEILTQREMPDQFPAKALSWVFDDAGNKSLVFSASSLGGFVDGNLFIGGKNFRYDDATNRCPEIVSCKHIIDGAMQYLNVPYLWGGRSIFGIDCSGLVQNVFKTNGIRLNRDASFQARQGETLHLIDEAQPGDLAFFDNSEGQIVHVGIIAGNGKIIHSSGFVRIDEIDHEGIFNKKLRKYTHKLRLVKRILK